MKYHFTTIIKKTRNNKYWCRFGEKEPLVHCWKECKLVKPLWETVWKFLKKLKVELQHDPAIPLLCFYSKKQNHYLKKRYIYISLCALQHYFQ